jgi:hypothetical protein
VLAYGPNSDSVALPAAVQRRMIISVTGFYTSIVQDPYPMLPRATEEVGTFALSGVPQVYDIMGINIFVRPMPSTSFNLSINFVPALVELNLVTDVPSEFPSEFHRLMGYMAALRIRMQNQDPGDGIESIVSDWKRRLQAHMKGIHLADGVRHVGQPSPFETVY